MTQTTADEISNYMLWRQLSQADLAKLLKVARCTVNRWLKGHTPIPDDIDDRLAALAIPINEKLYRRVVGVRCNRAGRRRFYILTYDDGTWTNVAGKDLRWFLAHPDQGGMA